MSLEHDVKNAYWGYVRLETDGSFRHVNRTTYFSFLRPLLMFSEALSTGLDKKFLPKDYLPYQGILSWAESEGQLHVYMEDYRSNTNHEQKTKLRKEFERIAKFREAAKIYQYVLSPKSQIYIPLEAMISEGWTIEHSYPDETKLYSKKI